MEEVYKRLALKLDNLPQAFPATESGVELKILRKIFTPDEAEMALKMRPVPETSEAIAQRLGIPLDEMQVILDSMVEKGQIGTTNMGQGQVYLFAPFVIGIFEFQLNRLDKELADLMEEYGPYLMKSLGGHKPELMRVVPLNIQIDAEHTVYTYEDLRKVMEEAKAFQVVDCICRKEQALHGNTCKHSVEVCLGFSRHEQAFDKYSKGRSISRDEALQILAKADEEGLVHCTYNVQQGQMFVCNCCSCCCGILRGIKKFNAPHALAKSNYRAVIDQETCVACGTCAEERCPMDAIVEEDGAYAVRPERCIGCGVCVSTCPSESITLMRKPESEHESPPTNIVEWYVKRSQTRGVPLSID